MPAELARSKNVAQVRNWRRYKVSKGLVTWKRGSNCLSYRLVSPSSSPPGEPPSSLSLRLLQVCSLTRRYSSVSEGERFRGQM
ncbi:Hypothetical protein NTJ_13335 [Nesidiocoris tenuis]|uniref:PH domain-containing protein n=1 Tax=Nesidiocoris tenuis TaxID=355587 RepID=A0ABN7B8B1_9HEMI|nr:Hypothetical protein NTJ_13335 [Nesidiocoris tenuis]